MGQTARTRLVTALMLFVVFGAGVLLGLAADSELGASPTPVVTVEAEDSADAEPEEERRPRGLYRQVEPDESQLVLIDSIVAEYRARTNALDEEFRTDFRAIVLETRESIKEVLTPEQAAEYQRIVEEWDAERAAEREEDEERD